MNRNLVLMPIITIITIIGIGSIIPYVNGQNLENNISTAESNNIDNPTESLTIRCPIDPETGLRDCPQVNCAIDHSDPSCPKPFPEDDCERTLKGCPCDDPSGLSCPQPGRGPTASINDSDFSNNSMMIDSGLNTLDTEIGNSDFAARPGPPVKPPINIQ
jgi:hypothetical protein